MYHWTLIWQRDLKIAGGSHTTRPLWWSVAFVLIVMLKLLSRSALLKST
jgi:hypothetical protein